ncbi:hypothetical protein E4U13_006082, partial [Claviceps humidiphila]
RVTLDSKSTGFAVSKKLGPYGNSQDAENPKFDTPRRARRAPCPNSPTILRRAYLQDRRHGFRRSHGEKEELYHSGLRTQSRRLGFLIRERNPVDVLESMNRFLEFVLDKSEAYQWKSCLEYAMRHHQSVKAECIHSPEAWLDHPRIRIDHDFSNFSALPPSQSTSQKRQRSTSTGFLSRKRHP